MTRYDGILTEEEFANTSDNLRQDLDSCAERFRVRHWEKPAQELDSCISQKLETCVAFRKHLKTIR